MASYRQYLARVRKRGVPRVVWLCGPDGDLVEDCINVAVAQFGSCQMIVADSDADEVWAALRSEVEGLLVVHNVDVIADWEPGWTWVAQDNKTTRRSVLFVSNQFEFDRRRRMQATVAEHGYFVRCVTPTDAGLRRWLVDELGPLDESVKSEVIDRCDGSVLQMRDLVQRVRLLNVAVTQDAVRHLVPLLTSQQFVRRLLRGQKELALAALQNLGPEQFEESVRLLDERVDFMEKLRSAVLANRVSEFARSVGPTGLWDTQLLWSAVDYDSTKCAAARSLVAAVSEQVRAGRGREALTALVALW